MGACHSFGDVFGIIGNVCPITHEPMRSGYFQHRVLGLLGLLRWPFRHGAEVVPMKTLFGWF